MYIYIYTIYIYDHIYRRLVMIDVKHNVHQVIFDIF